MNQTESLASNLISSSSVWSLLISQIESSDPLQTAATTPVFLMGLGLGVGLLLLGLFLGLMIGRRTNQPALALAKTESLDQEQILMIAHELATWTSRFSGDVTKYQGQLSDIRDKVDLQPSDSSKDEVVGLLRQIMDANKQLQARLDTAEEKLAQQTTEIASYLTEARTDGLTGLSNRRAFDQAMDELFRQSLVSKEKLSLALIDIDHFKKINDTHGHQAGDQVLQELASRLKQNLPDASCIARFGGEEFAVLFKAPLHEAAKIMDRMRQAIEGELFETEKQSLRVTGSMGVAELLADERIGKLVRRSDEALYAAKLGGRNRVYIHDGKTCQLLGAPAGAPTATSNPLGSPSTTAAPQNTTSPLIADLQSPTTSAGNSSSIPSNSPLSKPAKTTPQPANPGLRLAQNPIPTPTIARTDSEKLASQGLAAAELALSQLEQLESEGQTKAEDSLDSHMQVEQLRRRLQERLNRIVTEETQRRAP